MKNPADMARQHAQLVLQLTELFRAPLRAGETEAAQLELEALGGFVADRKRRAIAIERGHHLDTVPPPASGGMAVIADVCGKRCDHDSECLLTEHEPPGRHETQHGCVFYDAEPADGEFLPEGYRR